MEGLNSLLDLAASYPVGRAAALTGIPAQRLHSLADTICTARYVTLHMSVGVNQGPFGTLCIYCPRSLAYLAGHFDVRAACCSISMAVRVARLAQRWGVGTQPGYSRVGQFPSILDSLPAGILAEEILTPGAEQLRALLVVDGELFILYTWRANPAPRPVSVRMPGKRGPVSEDDRARGRLAPANDKLAGALGDGQ